MRILVTGGAGFIGSHIVDAYIGAGFKVTVLDNLFSGRTEFIHPEAEFVKMDIRDSDIERIIQDGKFDVINHHAAQVSVSYSIKEPQFDAEVNILGTLNLLNAAVKYKVKKFIFASSGGTVYGEPPFLPAKEDFPLKPFSPYGISKVAIEYYLPVFSRNYGLIYTSLRYSNVYGPRQDPYGEAGVVAIFAKAMLAGNPPTIFGDGEHKRDYVFVEDVVKANLLSIEKGDNEAFNIGTGIATTTNQIFDLIRDQTGYNGERRYGPERPGDLRASVLDYSKAKSVLGWEPVVSLKKGIRMTVDYFRYDDLFQRK